MNLQAVIVAGGKGTRLGPLAANLPKALAPVAGRPLLDYSLRLLKRHGLDDVIICVGHLGGQIRDFVGDGASWGLRVRYSEESSPLGTAGCLRAIQPPSTRDLLVLYADVLMELDLAALAAAHDRSGADATLAVHPNNHPYDSDLVEADPVTGWVQAIHKKPHPPNAWLPNLVNASLYILKPRLLNLVPLGAKADCAQDLFPEPSPPVAVCWPTVPPRYLKDIGTPDRLREAEEEIGSGRVARSNRNQARPAVFLDRDGVINREANLIHDPDPLELIPGAAAALRRLNRAGWLTVVVTNQPVVARGLCGLDTLSRIHHKLETLLGAEGAFVECHLLLPPPPRPRLPRRKPGLQNPLRLPQARHRHDSDGSEGLEYRSEGVFPGRGLDHRPPDRPKCQCQDRSRPDRLRRQGRQIPRGARPHRRRSRRCRRLDTRHPFPH